ncbi:MAG TPA: menaquinol-cytochrome c reductase cytochrome b subunit [Actinomycetota bacterium]|nr:menaquinol-cytochrome c reductase cytochrome b subunit [Actinomycetota bacterium]
MPTPDEVYEQVLKEETNKGSAPAVAQGRAKAARVRAQRGSANPNKPDPSTAPPPDSAREASGGAPAAEAQASEQPSAEATEQPKAEATQQPKAAATSKPAASRPAARPSSPAPTKKAVGNGAGPAVPERVQRLLAVVKPEAIQKVERQPMDRVNVWPHLMAAEFVSLLVVMALLTFFSLGVDAPLRELANFNQTPNPSKAPWYFLGLQELLRYFHPQVAGVTIPNVLILTAFAAPFIDRNPSTRPDDRKLAIVLFSFFMLAFAGLTIIGMFFRGPGFNFVFPWDGGIFFEL